MKPIFEFDYKFNKYAMLSEIDRFKGECKAYEDPRHPPIYNFKLIKSDKLKVAQKETNKFLDFYQIKNKGSGRYYILDKNTDLGMHTDHNTICSINAILNSNTAPITIEDQDYHYSVAVLDTQKMHGVKNNNSERYLFKISFFDLEYKELVEIVSHRKTT